VYINALTELGMEQLKELSLSCELCRDEFVRKLSVQSASVVKRLRELLFEEALKDGLVVNGDKLVMRKKVGGGISVKAKHVEDV
jgi:hypothetical protein